MGILYNNYKFLSSIRKNNRLFSEGAADDADADNPTDDATVANDTKNDDSTNTVQNDTATDTNQQNNADHQNANNNDDVNFDDFGGENDDNYGEEDDSENRSNADDSSDDEQEVDELKKQEEELFSDLSPVQLDIKHKELKDQYLTMYDNTNYIIDRISNVSINEDTTLVLEFISSNIANLRSMIIDYINDVYKTKSYTENLVNYNRFLAVMNGINKILEEIIESKGQ